MLTLLALAVAVAHPAPAVAAPPSMLPALLAPAKFAYSSRYLTMRDGVRIAIDVYLPVPLAADTRLPTIILQTRYYRSHRVMWPFSAFWAGYLEPTISRYVARGYAFVVVDARGSGASFGVRSQEWSPDEIRDGAEVVDWIVAQRWSNGRVGTTGGSYDGTAAEFLLANAHPAVLAAAPRSAMYDIYADMAFPGGVKLAPFIDFWGRVTAAQDSNRMNSMLSWFPRLVYRGVKPVQGDSGEALLTAATREHATNYNMPALVARQEFRGETQMVEAMSTYARRDDVARSGAAIYGISGWYDGALAASAIKRYLTIRTPGSRLILGPWSHQGENLSPFATRLKDFDHTEEILRFFDHHLKPGDSGGQPEAAVRYYTVGEEKWKTAPTWPPPGTVPRMLYLSDNGSLADHPSVEPRAADRYIVDFSTGSGQETRWNNLTELDVKHAITPDRRERDRALLVYASAPLDTAIEVTGHPSLTLHVESSEVDGAVFVYLEDVDQRGTVYYVTEGVLRLIHRHTTAAAAPYVYPVPFRTYTKADAASMVPGEIATVTVDLFPISYLFRRGHSVRIAIAGADADHFARIPAVGPPPIYRFYRDATHPSALVLPTMP